MHVLSNTYFAPLLLRNRRHAALAAALGPRPFRSLARYLLRPAAPVAADVDAFLFARRHGTLAPSGTQSARSSPTLGAPSPAAPPPPPPLRLLLSHPSCLPPASRPPPSPLSGKILLSLFVGIAHAAILGYAGLALSLSLVFGPSSFLGGEAPSRAAPATRPSPP